MARKGLTPLVPDPPELKPIAIDGKAQRGSARRTVGRSALHVVITAIPELLELLDLVGAVVPIDAMGCQTEAGWKNDYLLSVLAQIPEDSGA